MLQEDDTITTNQHLISNILNNHFNQSANFDSQSTSDYNAIHSNYLINNSPNSFFLIDTSEEEVTSIVKSLKNSHSAGDDNISNALLKNLIHTIIRPLTHIINLSLKMGEFPSQLKTSKIIPLFKSGDKCLASNYRPISLVSSLSKILEKVVHKQLTSFLDKSNLLSLSQYGFRNKSSTELAILDICSHISNNFESKLFTAGVFIDLSKAFDSLDHNILIQKMNNYGIRGTPLKWFCSYLSDRYHYVQIENKKSKVLKVVRGVPQGSILGPILFNIYINDICNCSSILKMVLFADDTTVLLSNSDANELARLMTLELDKLYLWTKYNKLNINFDKTCCILFGPKIRTNPINIKIFFNNNLIKNVSSTKFLGIIITSNLSWLDHIFLSLKI